MNPQSMNSPHRSLQTNLLGRAIKEEGYYGRKGTIVCIYQENGYLYFLIEFPDGELKSLLKEQFTLQ